MRIADLDFLLGLDEVGDATHAGRREFRDVDESLDAGLELDEGAEVHEPGDLALDHTPRGYFVVTPSQGLGVSCFRPSDELARSGRS